MNHPSPTHHPLGSTDTPMPLHRNPRLLAVGAALALATLISACGGGSTPTSSNPTSTTPGGSSGSGGAGGNAGFQGTSGSVAALSGSSMEVQNQQSGQVTVNWTSSTAFSKTVNLSASSVADGDCVAITGSTTTGHLVATSVTISQPSSSGACTGGFGRGARGTGSGAAGSAPANGGSLPSRPARSFPGGGAGFAFASGKVTSISPTTLVLYGVSSSGVPRASGQGSTPPTSVKSTSVTVGLSASTLFTKTQTAAASSLAVGDCVTANGSTDTTGAVTARTVRITSTGGQTCSTGFGPGAGQTSG